MRTALCLLSLLVLLGYASTINSKAAFRTCTDNDQDGTCADVDCNDNNAFLNNGDFDADGVTSCAGDCDDSDASVNACTEEERIEPDYFNMEANCSYTYLGRTYYHCPWGSGPPPAGSHFPESCTFVYREDYLIQDTCNP